jgi:peptidyl-prolyl cis-trans isomerase SurA
MMIKKNIQFIILLLMIINFKLPAVADVFIVSKIENQIITNIDIENEARYLMALNTQLKNLDNKKILSIAKQSIIKETIKENELLKYLELDQTNEYLQTVVKEFYLKLGLKNKEEFDLYLKKHNLILKNVEKKLEIEAVWNQLIYEKYKNQININENDLKKRVKENNVSEDKTSYLLSEIVFEKDKDEALKKKISRINESIKEIGFKNTANIYSISDSSKFGGEVGWIESKNFSKNIYKTIKNLEIGEYTKPIQLGSGFLILKVDDIKVEKIKVNEEKELKKLIQFETNKQLEQFSKIYFNKIKINTNISEL